MAETQSAYKVVPSKCAGIRIRARGGSMNTNDFQPVQASSLIRTVPYFLPATQGLLNCSIYVRCSPRKTLYFVVGAFQPDGESHYPYDEGLEINDR